MHRPLHAALTSFLVLIAAAPAAAQPSESPLVPASIRPLVPRGWEATSYAASDFNKDGKPDRAFLLEPVSHAEEGQDPRQGTPLRDKCHNLALQIGLGDGAFAPPNYLPWSLDQTRFMQHVVPADLWNECAASVELFALRGTLRARWTYEEADWGDGAETQVYRIEGQCLRLIGADYKGSDTFQGEEEHNISANFLTNTQIETHVFVEESRTGEIHRRKEGPTTTKLEAAAPVCANAAPLVSADLAGQPSPIPPPTLAPPKAATAIPPPAATDGRARAARPTATPDAPYLPPSPLLPRTECLIPPLPMLDHYRQANSGFGDELLTPCDDDVDTDSCKGVPHTMTFGDVVRFSIGDVEYEDTVIWAVDDCGLWLRETNYVDRTTAGWAPEKIRRGRYFVLPKQPDGSYFFERELISGRGFRFTPSSGNLWKVLVVQ